MKNFDLKVIFVIVITSIFIGLLYNHFNPNGISFIRVEKELKWESDSSQTILPSVEENKKDLDTISSNQNKIIEHKKFDLQPFSEPRAIKIDLAYKLFNEGIKFIDARPVEEFEESHIKGAINIPFYGSEEYESTLSKISKDEIVITYCNGDDCDLSTLLGEEIFKKGYKKVYVFFGGWNDWLKKGYPIEK